MQYEYPIQNESGISIQKGIFMRILIHVIGDMHQPLHNASLFNSTYTDGDIGGNLEKLILLNGTAMNMHSYFDSGALRLDSFARPLSAEKLETIHQLGETYRMMNPRSLFGDRIKITDPIKWSQETYDIARDVIYPYTAFTNKITA